MVLGFKTAVFWKALSLKARKEAFVCGIVIAVPLRAHALRKPIELQELSKLLTGVLAPAIRMKQRPTAWR